MEISREVVLEATVDEVWQLITDEGELGHWLAESVRLDPSPGALGEVRDHGEVLRMRVDQVLEADVARRFVFTWWPEDGGPTSEVTMTVEETAEGAATRLRVRERITGGAGLRGRRVEASLWDDRLLGLELRCIARSSLAHC